jgi:2-keto-3-deoxy-L-rhamnonate aldolase RhmA
MEPGLRIGCWLCLPSPEAAEIVAGTGFDFALVDVEHGAIGCETAHRLMAFAASATLLFLRAPYQNEAWIKRALDAGAAAVMMPRVEDPPPCR